MGKREGMSDLEIVRVCAEMMDIPLRQIENDLWTDVDECVLYWPLTDDAQAMGLVKRFRLRTMFNAFGNWWTVKDDVHSDGSPSVAGQSESLNRAICLCCLAALKAQP